MGTMLMCLEGGTREHFLDFLSSKYPHLVAGYGRLYAGTYAGKDYAHRFRSVVGALKMHLGVSLASPTTHADATESKLVLSEPRPRYQPLLRFDP